MGFLPLILMDRITASVVILPQARLAQSVERQPFKLVVVGSSPTVGTFLRLVDFEQSAMCSFRRLILYGVHKF